MQLIFFSLFIAGLLYSALLLYLLKTTLRIPRPRRPIGKTDIINVSIIIPCKNEAQNISALFTSLNRLEFKGDIEIIIIDDGSTDGTIDKVNEHISDMKYPIRCLKSNFNPHKRLTSKQQAIDFGIEAAHHEWIVLTDADMSFSPFWLQSFVDSLKDSTDLIFGHTAIKRDGNLFSLFQSFQLEFLFAIASVFHYAGIVGSCMGNNLMINKKTYVASGGYQAIGYSITEDRALLYHFTALKKNIAIITPFYPTAYTLPQSSLKSYFDQVIRWAKGGMSFGKNLLFIALLFSLQNISIVLLLFSDLNIVFSGITIFNFIITWIMILFLFRQQKAPVSALLFPLFYIFILLGTVVLPISAVLKKRVFWKGSSV